MIANYPILPIRPGSMGRPMLGINPGVIDENGNEVPPSARRATSRCVRAGRRCSATTGTTRSATTASSNGWYITGDRARKDPEGYFWFIGRADDVINTAGHLVGPFEVESALIEHPAVAEAGVIGKPDPVADGDREGVRRAEGRLRAQRRATA